MKTFYAFLFLGLLCAQSLWAQSTAFTYQGRLNTGGQPATGLYDFLFALRDATNAPVAATNFSPNVLVSNGLFTVSLDFGRNAFRGADRWLEIFVRTNGAAAFVPLSPRQPITPSPYSLASLEADLQNSNYGVSSTIGGGLQNVVSNEYSTVGGGYLNRIGGVYSTIGGGYDNQITKDGGTIGGGSGNRVGALGGTVAGGYANIAFGDYSGVGAGLFNSATANFSTIGGGMENRATGIGSFVGGGGTDGTFQFWNSASGGGAAVVGGVDNHAQGLDASIGGGRNGVANGDYSTIPGGYNNRAIGDFSFAAGHQAFAGHEGTFVWADALSGFFSSTAPNQFLVRASGGVGLGTPSPATKLHLYSTDNPTTFRIQSTGTPGFGRIEFVSNPQGDANEWRPAYIQSLDTGGFTGGLGFYVNGTGFDNRFSTNEVMRIVNGRVGIGTNNPQSTLHVSGTLTATTINPTSDRNAKENFAPVSAQEVLGKVAALPISRWNFKGDNSTHVGPMAQDFHAAFGVGTDNKHIATVDADGVALAAIQGLNQKLEEKNARIAELEKRLEKLERLFAAKP